MATVTCITVSSSGPKDCRKITRIRTDYSKDWTPAQAHDYVKAIPGSIICVGDGKSEPLLPAMREGVKYVRTRADDTEADNLLKQRACV